MASEAKRVRNLIEATRKEFASGLSERMSDSMAGYANLEGVMRSGE